MKRSVVLSAARTEPRVRLHRQFSCDEESRMKKRSNAIRRRTTEESESNDVIQLMIKWQVPTCASIRTPKEKDNFE